MPFPFLSLQQKKHLCEAGLNPLGFTLSFTSVLSSSLSDSKPLAHVPSLHKGSKLQKGLQR